MGKDVKRKKYAKVPLLGLLKKKISILEFNTFSTFALMNRRMKQRHYPTSLHHTKAGKKKTMKCEIMNRGLRTVTQSEKSAICIKPALKDLTSTILMVNRSPQANIVTPIGKSSKSVNITLPTSLLTSGMKSQMTTNMATDETFTALLMIQHLVLVGISSIGM